MRVDGRSRLLVAGVALLACVAVETLLWAVVWRERDLASRLILTVMPLLIAVGSVFFVRFFGAEER